MNENQTKTILLLQQQLPNPFDSSSINKPGNSTHIPDMELEKSIEFIKNLSLNFRNSEISTNQTQLPKITRSKKIEKLRIKVDPLQQKKWSQLKNQRSQVNIQCINIQKNTFKFKLKKTCFKNDDRFSCEETTDLSDQSVSKNVAFDFLLPESSGCFSLMELLNYKAHFDKSAYLKNVNLEYLKQHATMTAKSRATLINWMLLVHHKFKLGYQTFFTGVNIVDLYCSQVVVESGQFQLLAVTALFMASKFEEVKQLKLCKFLMISENQFSSEQIIYLEGEIMRTINFQISTSSPLQLLEIEAAIQCLPTSTIQLAKLLLISSCFDLRMSYFGTEKMVESAIDLAKLIQAKKNSPFFCENWDFESLFGLNFALAGSYDNVCVRNLFLIVVNLEKAGLFAIRKLFLDLTVSNLEHK